MATRIFLTFGIPTLNGEKHIAQTIDSVLNVLIGKQINNIEILVSDNCSTDRTGEIVQGYAKKHPQYVRYVRNNQNIGYDNNLNSVISNSHGEFVWFLGDDDYLVPDAPHIIINKIYSFEQHHPDVLVAPVQYYDIRSDIYLEGRQVEKDRCYSNGEDFIRENLWATAPMSSLIVRKSAWSAVKLEEFCGTQWSHVGAVIKLAKHSTIILLSSPKVVVRTGNPRWCSNFGNQLLSGMTHLNVMSSIVKEGYAPDIFENYVESRFLTNFVAIVSMKTWDVILLWRIAKLMAKYFYKKPTFWLFHLPVLILCPNLFTLKNKLEKSSPEVFAKRILPTISKYRRRYFKC